LLLAIEMRDRERDLLKTGVADLEKYT